MTDKEKIKAEIERIKKNQEGVYNEYSDGKFDLCEHLLSFIDSMPEEPTSDDLEEEIRQIAGDYEQVDVAWNNDFDFIARHFASWQKQQDAKLPHIHPRDTLDEYAYQCAYDLSNDWAKETPDWHDVKTACKLGAEWKQQQMMKNALTCTVERHYDKRIGKYLTPDIVLNEKTYKEDDKVKLIIIKED